MLNTKLSIATLGLPRHDALQSLHHHAQHPHAPSIGSAHTRDLWHFSHTLSVLSAALPPHDGLWLPLPLHTRASVERYAPPYMSFLNGVSISIHVSSPCVELDHAIKDIGGLIGRTSASNSAPTLKKHGRLHPRGHDGRSGKGLMRSHNLSCAHGHLLTC